MKTKMGIVAACIVLAASCSSLSAVEYYTGHPTSGGIVASSTTETGSTKAVTMERIVKQLEKNRHRLQTIAQDIEGLETLQKELGIFIDSFHQAVIVYKESLATCKIEAQSHKLLASSDPSTLRMQHESLEFCLENADLALAAYGDLAAKARNIVQRMAANNDKIKTLEGSGISTEKLIVTLEALLNTYQSDKGWFQ